MEKTKNTLTATIFITDKCNLACKYCYETNKQFTIIRKEYIDKFLALCFYSNSFENYDSIILDFIGGEAILEWKLMEYAMILFTKLNNSTHRWKSFYFSTCTNGTLFDNVEIKNFLNRWPRLHVALSLDGCKEAHDLNRIYLDGKGSYDDIIKNINWWRTKYNQYMVKGTLSPETLPLLSKSLINQINLGMTQLWQNPIFEHKWTEEEAKLYYDELKKVVDYIFDNNLYLKIHILGRPRPKDIHLKDQNYCGTGTGMICVGLDGNLYPCHRFATSTKFKYNIGNVVDGIDKEKYNKFINGLNKINDENNSTMYPICYASCCEANLDFKYKEATNIMTAVEWDIYDYWNSKLNDIKFNFKEIKNENRI